MGVWDRGEYEIHELRDDKLVVTFHGERVQGRYALFQTNGKNWIIHRMDPPSDPERVPGAVGRPADARDADADRADRDRVGRGR